MNKLQVVFSLPALSTCKNYCLQKSRPLLLLYRSPQQVEARFEQRCRGSVTHADSILTQLNSKRISRAIRNAYTKTGEEIKLE